MDIFITEKELKLNNLDRDYMLLSKDLTFKRIKEILSNNKIIICNLTDRFGKIGEKIDDVLCNTDQCFVVLVNGKKKILHDRYLYNIIYNEKKDKYLLEEHDEYYEKVEIDK